MSGPPPSYESVVNDLKSKLANKTPQDVKEVHQILLNLPAAHKKVIVDNAASVKQTPLTVAQKKAVGTAMVQAVGTQFAQENVRMTAQAATDAVKNIEAMFASCIQDLSTIDKDFPASVPQGGFVGKLRPVQDKFRAVVNDSRLLAVRIAVYGERFDQVIIPIVKDSKLDDTKKKEKLDQFIATAKDFMTDSGAINARYQTLKTDMDEVAGTFKNFALVQEKGLDDKISAINDKITELMKEIGEKRTAMYVAMGVTVAALPVAGVIAACAGPAAPAILLIGIIVAGAAAITATTLAFVINSLEDQKRAKERERDALKGQKQMIVDARKQLDGLKTTRFPEFKENIDILAAFWLSAQSDAQEIKDWLETGKQDVDTPDYLQTSVDNSITVYKQLAVYLKDYAKGIDQVIPPK